MWFLAGVLLGLALLVAVVGFHAGPHLHVAAVALGVVAAVLLIALAIGGHSSALLPEGGAGPAASLPAHKSMKVEGAEGSAVTDLDPQGIVRVRGERWSATSLNGFVAAGDPVQVIRVDGVRLAVWGELGLTGSVLGDSSGGRHPAFEPLAHEPLPADPAAEHSGGTLEGGAKC
jgi:hypothetical protein